MSAFHPNPVARASPGMTRKLTFGGQPRGHLDVRMLSGDISKSLPREPRAAHRSVLPGVRKNPISKKCGRKCCAGSP